MPMARLQIHPEWRPVLEANALSNFDALFAAGGAGRVDGHLRRSVSRLELARPGGGFVAVYLKRRWGSAARRTWSELLHGRWPSHPERREWRNAIRLTEAGVPVAEPVACGRSEEAGEPRCLIAFLEVPGESLAAWAADLPTETGDAEALRHRRAVAAALGQTVRHLHDAGCAFRDLYAKHLYVDLEVDSPPAAHLIDPQRVIRLTRRRRVRDLAALYETTRVPAVGATDRLRFLKAYLGISRLRAGDKRLVRRVVTEARRIAGRGRDPNLAAERQVAPPGMVPTGAERFAHADGRRLWINEAFREPLEAAGLATLDALMRFEGGRPYRVVAGRRTVRAELPRTGGAPTVAVYIKRYTGVPLRTAVRRTISLGEPVSFAFREARTIWRLTELGIPTMRVVAVGEELSRSGRRERSCLVTEEVAGATQADDFCEVRFACDDSPAAVHEKRDLVRRFAHLARTLHDAGMVHRDFYLCHILVRLVESAEPVLHLIDLQRVKRWRSAPPRRWIVKDLAALLFSSWPSPATGIRSPVFSDTDRLRFAREYFASDRLTAEQKSLLRSVVRKARRIDRHERRRQRRGGSS